MVSKIFKFPLLIGSSLETMSTGLKQSQSNVWDKILTIDEQQAKVLPFFCP